MPFLNPPPPSCTPLHTALLLGVSYCNGCSAVTIGMHHCQHNCQVTAADLHAVCATDETEHHLLQQRHQVFLLQAVLCYVPERGDCCSGHQAVWCKTDNGTFDHFALGWRIREKSDLTIA
ncbi:hypothetical protein JKP88DRAFT_254310 [Tribonema minus]|uniref:Secreted protein n=1 Tax=Tribonema minus TaxID=303371 RepID=A0A835Z4Q4_9STRA|nr:hypothetical protein JKP88DRAFT_254310 [Tribonema minus]